MILIQPSGIRTPKYTKRLPNVLPVDQMATIVAQPNQNDDPLIQRDNALFELMYSCGLRLSEAISNNIDLVLGRTWFALGKA